MIKTVIAGSRIAVLAFALGMSGMSAMPAAAKVLPQNDLVRVYYDAQGGTTGVFHRNCLNQSSFYGQTTGTFEDFLTSCSAETLDDPCNNWPGGSLGPCPF